MKKRIQEYNSKMLLVDQDEYFKKYIIEEKAVSGSWEWDKNKKPTHYIKYKKYFDNNYKLLETPITYVREVKD